MPVHLHQTPVPGEERYASLALVNTRYALTHGPVDLLADPDAAHLWLVRHALLPDHIALNGRQFGRLLGVRDAVRDAFTAYAARTPPPATPPPASPASAAASSAPPS
nr:ABATE domain-containing protein [Streptomyces sp. ST1020]